MLPRAGNFILDPNVHIKYPTITEGLKAAEISVKEGMRINMTLVFSQEQAAAVYAATRGAKKGQVFVSPFVGRLDDIGERGMDLIANILEMYHPTFSSPYKGREGREGVDDCHVEVLTASVRSVEHIQEAISLGSDILTAPIKVLNSSFPLSLEGRGQGEGGFTLKPIPYLNIDLNKPWQEYNIEHELTDKGLEKFASDWNKLII